MKFRIILICCFFSIFTNGIYSQDNTFLSISHETNTIVKVDESHSKLSELTHILLEPPDGRVYHGVQLMTFDNDTRDPIAGYLAALNDSTIQPAVRGLFFSIPGTRGPAKSLSELSKFLKTADSVGFIPELSLFLVSEVAEDSVIAVSDKYDWVLDSIITICKQRGKSMFLRIGGEFNGSGEGWNGGGYHPYLYVKMFRKIVDMFAARGFRDSIATNWCYEPAAANDFDSVDSRGARWYPGDDYVDWFGLDVFNYKDFDQSLPDYDHRGITNKGKSERFLAMAREKGKPVFMSETSAMEINISSDEQDGINDWNNWFAKFWHFIDVHKEIKGFAYINANWPIDAYPTWGDARIQNSPYVTQKYREEMKNPKYIHLNQTEQIGPWNNPLKIALSDDGINFTNESIFQDSAGVPCVIRWKGDTLACVFQWFRQPVNSPTWDKVAVKFSYNNGSTWSQPKPLVFTNMPANYQRPFDPTLVVLDDKTLHIYFSSSDGMPKPGMDSSINTYSAVSSDGINFEFEPGARFDNQSKKVIDPAVAFFNDEWHYISPAGAPQEGAYHATSGNGLDFTEKAKISSDNFHNWTGNFLVENDLELRFYGSGPNIWFSKSDNGYDWSSYTETNVKGGDPGIVKLGDNKYMMIYVGGGINPLNPPEKVMLISPQNNYLTNNSEIDLIWKKSYPDVKSYHLQISQTNRFGRYLVNDSTITDTTYKFTNLIADSSYFWRVSATNIAGSGPWSDVWMFKRNRNVSVDENEVIHGINIFPNPAGDFIEIDFNNESGFIASGNINIYNLNGEKVLTVKNIKTESFKIDISKLPTGVYFIEIGDKKAKFIKE